MQREEQGPGGSGGWGDMYRQEKKDKGRGRGKTEMTKMMGGKDDEGGESVSGRRVVNFGVRRGVDAGGRVRGAPGFKLRKNE